MFCEQARENSEFSLLIGFHTPNRMSHTRGRMRDDFYTKRATREQVLAVCDAPRLLLLIRTP